MGIKKINGGVEDFINKFVRARGGDSTGTDAAGAPASATGGVISYSGGKTIHTFTSSGTFNTFAAISSVEYLIVGGGGGGAGANGSADGAGAAGAGGVLTNHPDCPAPLRGGAFTIGIGPVSVIVGGGGAGAGFNVANGAWGSISQFGTPLIASGGGYGRVGPGDAGDGASGGGSGGGGSAGAGGSGNTWSPDAPGHPGSTPTIQGNTGGDNGPNYGSGGGGGFTAVGSDSPSNNGGPGGAGFDCSITGSTVGYAGGGGGGAAGPYRSPTLTGGTATHGGGAGANSDGSGYTTYAGTPGTANSGGGGGGGGGSNSPEPVWPTLAPNNVSGGTGGPGIVIITFPT